MGASASKPARAGAAAARRYPQRASHAVTEQTHAPPPPPPQQQRAPPRASSIKDEGIAADAQDPHLAAHLRTLGPVAPQPTLSHSSAAAEALPSRAASPALATLAARQRFEDALEAERTAHGHAARRFADAPTIRRALVLRDEKGLSDAEVERALGLRAGVVAGFGGVGVVEAV